MGPIHLGYNRLVKSFIFQYLIYLLGREVNKEHLKPELVLHRLISSLIRF